jgi:hypothetical protein
MRDTTPANTMNVGNEIALIVDTTVSMIAFDLIKVDGEDLRSGPLVDRKKPWSGPLIEGRERRVCPDRV